MTNKTRIYGIDLGTTNSCIASVDEITRKAEMKLNSEGDLLTPSVVYFEDGSPEPIVGKEAKRAARAHDDAVCFQIKREMGSDVFRFRGYRPEAISAFILRKIVSDALKYDEMTIKGGIPAVICVPAYFGDVERRATRAAAVISDIDVQDLIAEPVAAAFAYGFGRAAKSQNILVYDLGGGTFDVTVVKVDAESAHTVATEGVRLLGGMDWDHIVVDHFCQTIREQEGVDLDYSCDRGLKYQLFEQAEEAKVALSSATRTSMTIHHNGSSYSVSLGRDEFERLTEAQLERTIDKTRVAMKTAEEHGVCPIDKLLLVGGSSRMPAVRARLQKEFGLEGLLYDPDESIAKGAALVGDLIRKGQYRPNTTGVRTATGDVAALTFVTSKSLGIYVRKYDREEYYVDYLIDRNSPIPTNKTRQYFTLNDNQTYLDVRVMEQRQEPSPVPEENTLVHQRPLQFHIPLPKHSPLDVTYAIDSQQLLHIHVKEPKSGQTWEFDVARSGQITDAEIGALKAEFTHASALAT